MAGFLLILLLLLPLTYLYFRHEARVWSLNQAEQIASSLKKQDYSVTIPEGWRREQIAKVLDQAGVCSYADFMSASQGMEGYLFPDTYRFFHNTPASQVVATMTANFAKRTAGLNPTANQLILASIVEREAKYETERAPIAGVYTNRLKVGMVLEADPTVQYARDNQEASENLSYWAPITQADYHTIQSPYNTYLHTGLPPGPIDNPGLPSIIAAINPEKNSYYYFFQRNGNIYLSKTLAEHLSKLNQ